MRQFWVMGAIVLIGCALGLAALLSAAPAPAHDSLQQMAQNPKDWVMQSGDYANWRYSALNDINTGNVGKLTPVWTFSTGVLRGHAGGPLVIGDVMYLVTPFPNIVYALDLDHPGRILWKYVPKQDPAVVNMMCCDTVNRGVQYADDKIILDQTDATLTVLDAKTGRRLWSEKYGDPTKGETGVMAPLIVKHLVIIGNAGATYGVRGAIAAYDLTTGKRIWRAASTGSDKDMLVDPAKTTELGRPIGKDSGLESWPKEQWKEGGGTVAGWISYDPKLDLIYYGTSAPAPSNPLKRAGDNRWTASVFARDAETGMARWVYQFTPHDAWGYGANGPMILATLTLGGKDRDVLVHFDGNGFAYVLDRLTGELLMAQPYDVSLNWAHGITVDKAKKTYGRPQIDARYTPGQKGEDSAMNDICPAALGAKGNQPASFSPQTRLFYVPTAQLCMDETVSAVDYTSGGPYVGATYSAFPAQQGSDMGALVAFDARAGKIVWSDPERFSIWSGVLATAGGVVFYGTLEGWLKAVDAKTGKLLYEFKTPSGIIGNVMTYEHDGRQYVAVLSGIGGLPGLGLASSDSDPHAGLGAVGANAGLKDYTALGGSLTVFGLPAQLR